MFNLIFFYFLFFKAIFFPFLVFENKKYNKVHF